MKSETRYLPAVKRETIAPTPMAEHLLYGAVEAASTSRKPFWRTPTYTLLMPTIDLHTRRMSASELDPDGAWLLVHNYPDILWNLRSKCPIDVSTSEKVRFASIRRRNVKWKNMTLSRDFNVSVSQLITV